jgi:hypothetical protein
MTTAQKLDLLAQKRLELDALFTEAQRDLESAIEDLEADIKQAVLIGGENVKGTELQAIWSSGRISWDGRGLDGYAVANPEINAFRKEGSPSVSIRRI